MTDVAEISNFGFPLAVDGAGAVVASGGDEAIRGKIIQVLFTSPGERVNQPEFGCGLLNLVFEPNNDVLAVAAQFTIRQALTRWIGNEIIVDAVQVQDSLGEESIVVEVAYTKKTDLSPHAVRIQFRNA